MSDSVLIQEITKLKAELAAQKEMVVAVGIEFFQTREPDGVRVRNIRAEKAESALAAKTKEYDDLFARLIEVLARTWKEGAQILREAAENTNYQTPSTLRRIADLFNKQAADARTAIARLKEAISGCTVSCSQCDEAKARIEVLETALIEIANSAPCCEGHESSIVPGQPCDQRIARSALCAPKPKLAQEDRP
jgi:hypothetical protein